MSTNRPTVGSCPQCEVAISSSSVLIRYESNGERKRWAECTECGDVVEPI